MVHVYCMMYHVQCTMPASLGVGHQCLGKKEMSTWETVSGAGCSGLSSWNQSKWCVSNLESVPLLHRCCQSGKLVEGTRHSLVWWQLWSEKQELWLQVWSLLQPMTPAPNGSVVLHNDVIIRKEKKRHAFWRQFNEKPSIIPGCPGCHPYSIDLFFGCKNRYCAVYQAQAQCHATIAGLCVMSHVWGCIHSNMRK